MKKFFLLSVGLLITLPAMGLPREPKEVMIGTTNVHVPTGFDANDHVTLIVTGELPSTCWRRPRGEAMLINGRIVINTMATKIIDPEVNCIPAVVPYMVSISVGTLPQGTYEIAVNPSTLDEKVNTLTVEQPSSQSIDNHTYANVTNVTYIPETKKLAIEGTHPSSCMDIKDIQILANNKKDTLSLLTIIEQTEATCDRTTRPFVQYVDFNTATNKDILIHARLIDGNALNVLITKEQLNN
jgi:hypothetical protein